MKLKGTYFYSYLSKFKNGLWLPHLIPSNRVLGDFFRIHKSGYFVQIGSHDGLKNDPLHHFLLNNEQWYGDLIEPVTSIYEKLVKNLADIADRVRFHNCAIGIKDEEQPFYFIKGSENLPNWIEQAGSLNKDMLTRLEINYPDIAGNIEIQNVLTYSFDTFTKKNKIDKIDLLHIDTEGYDHLILNSINLKKWDIPLIMFEHLHINKLEYKSLLKKLSELNYDLTYWEYDTIAMKRL